MAVSERDSSKEIERGAVRGLGGLLDLHVVCAVGSLDRDAACPEELDCGDRVVRAGGQGESRNRIVRWGRRSRATLEIDDHAWIGRRVVRITYGLDYRVDPTCAVLVAVIVGKTAVV